VRAPFRTVRGLGVRTFPARTGASFEVRPVERRDLRASTEETFMNATAGRTTAFDLAGRLRAGATVQAGWMGIGDPIFAEIVARSGFDALVLDMQHGMFGPASLAGSIGAAAGAGKSVAVRVPVGDMAMASRALDMGAAAVIAPMIDTVEQARAFADAMKFAPLGRRSWGPGRAMMLSGESVAQRYLTTANRDTLALAMIETREGLDAVEDILAVPGIDGVFVGPNDLSIALSGGDRVDPHSTLVDLALTRIVEAAKGAGKIAGIFGGAPERVKIVRQFGFTFVSIGHDTAYVKAGIEAMIAAAGVTTG